MLTFFFKKELSNIASVIEKLEDHPWKPNEIYFISQGLIRLIRKRCRQYNIDYPDAKQLIQEIEGLCAIALRELAEEEQVYNNQT